MLSARTFARQAPRAVARMTTASMRQPLIARPVAVSAGVCKSAAAAPLPASRAAFSATAGRWAPSETDQELSAKLDSEIQIEEDMKASEQVPSSVKDFLDNSPFELVDTPGEEVVKLVRNLNGEKITVSFTIADLMNFDPYDDPAFDDAVDEDDITQNPNKQSHVPSSGGARSARAEEQLEHEQEQHDEDLEDDGLADEESPVQCNMTVLVEKPGKSRGALSVEASVQDGAVVVESMHFYEDAAVAKLDGPADAHRRASAYPGPPFGSLDDDLKVMVERFLEERGVTQHLALFVPDYIDIKEQKEYTRWLSNVKGFVDA